MNGLLQGRKSKLIMSATKHVNTVNQSQTEVYILTFPKQVFIISAIKVDKYDLSTEC